MILPYKDIEDGLSIFKLNSLDKRNTWGWFPVSRGGRVRKGKEDFTAAVRGGRPPSAETVHWTVFRALRTPLRGRLTECFLPSVQEAAGWNGLCKHPRVSSNTASFAVDPRLDPVPDPIQSISDKHGQNAPHHIPKNTHEHLATFLSFCMMQRQEGCFHPASAIVISREASRCKPLSSRQPRSE